MFGVVYHVFNTINGKSYIGQTTRGITRRWIEHRCGKKQLDSCMPLLHAIRKYGQDNFVITQLAECESQKELDEAEMHFIEIFHSLVIEWGYNVRQGGSAGALSDETKRKISTANQGRKHTPEARAAISAANRKRVYAPPTAEARRNMSEAQTGLKRSPESVEKRRLAHVGMKYKKRKT